jgi:hypothetical protein
MLSSQAQSFLNCVGVSATRYPANKVLIKLCGQKCTTALQKKNTSKISDAERFLLRPQTVAFVKDKYCPKRGDLLEEHFAELHKSRSWNLPGDVRFRWIKTGMSFLLKARQQTPLLIQQ